MLSVLCACISGFCKPNNEDEGCLQGHKLPGRLSSGKSSLGDSFIDRDDLGLDADEALLQAAVENKVEPALYPSAMHPAERACMSACAPHIQTQQRSIYSAQTHMAQQLPMQLMW